MFDSKVTLVRAQEALSPGELGGGSPRKAGSVPQCSEGQGHTKLHVLGPRSSTSPAGTGPC